MAGEGVGVGLEDSSLDVMVGEGPVVVVEEEEEVRKLKEQ